MTSTRLNIPTFTSSTQVLIVMTDGKSQDSVVQPSRDLRNAGVRILALGIGRRTRQSQLNQMAMNRRYVFNADFRNLHRAVSSIKRTACGGKFHYCYWSGFRQTVGALDRCI